MKLNFHPRRRMSDLWSSLPIKIVQEPNKIWKISNKVLYSVLPVTSNGKKIKISTAISL